MDVSTSDGDPPVATPPEPPDPTPPPDPPPPLATLLPQLAVPPPVHASSLLVANWFPTWQPWSFSPTLRHSGSPPPATPPSLTIIAFVSSSPPPPLSAKALWPPPLSPVLLNLLATPPGWVEQKGYELKFLSFQLPLYEVARLVFSSSLPLYEDLFTALCSFSSGFKSLFVRMWHLDEYFVSIPVNRMFLDSGSPLVSFMEFAYLLDTPFVVSGILVRWVSKSSTNRWLCAFLKIVNCALVAVSISEFYNLQGFILLANSIVVEIRGLLYDYRLFKCFVAPISLCFLFYLGVSYVCIAMMALYFENHYSVYGV